MWDLLRPDYRAHARFIAPAHIRPQFWRLIFGVVLTIAVFVFLNQAFANFIRTYLWRSDDALVIPAVGEPWGAAITLYVLVQLGLLIPSVGFVVFAVHQRPWSTLIGPRALAWSQFKAVLVALALLTLVVAVLPPYSMGDAPLSRNMDFGNWVMLLPVSLLAVLLQSSAEEIVFRGYLQQQVAARFDHPAIWLLGPSLLFGLLHYDGGAGSNAWTIVGITTLFAILMADVTARAGTLGPAIALHAINNVQALVLVAPDGYLSGLALCTTPFSLDDEAIVRAWLPVDVAMMLTSWLAVRLVLRR